MCMYVQMLNHLTSVKASDSLICADSFIIGVLDDEERGAPLDSTTTQWRRRAFGYLHCVMWGESRGFKAQELASEVSRIGVANPSPRQEHHCLS